jgi:hypothetical protein
MNDQGDDAQTWALAVVAGVIVLVIGGVIALAAATSLGRATAPKNMAAGEAPAPFETLYFDSGSDALPRQALDVLGRVSNQARAHAGAAVLVAVFGEPRLAERRAVALRHALEANGVPPQQVVIVPAPPERAGTDAGAPQRADVWLQ